MWANGPYADCIESPFDPLVLDEMTIFEGDYVNSVAWSPDGTLLAEGGKDQFVRVYDTATGKPTWSEHNHTGFVSTVASLAWKNGPLIVSVLAVPSSSDP